MKVKNSPSHPPRNDLEVEIIRHFIASEKQERLLFLQNRRRNEFVDAFHTEKFLNLAVATEVKLSTDIYALMKKFGASDECYAVSCMRKLDARLLSLNEALEMCVGSTRETLLYCPKTGVGYYEGGGYTNRYVMVNPFIKLAAAQL